MLDFYCCYRAYVRGKVAGLRLAEADVSNDEHDGLVREARSYFDLAAGYASAADR